MEQQLIIRLEKGKFHCVYSDKIAEVIILDENNDVSVMETAELSLLDPRKLSHIESQLDIIQKKSK